MQTSFSELLVQKTCRQKDKEKKCFIDPLNYLFFLLKTNFFDIFEINKLQEK